MYCPVIVDHELVQLDSHECDEQDDALEPQVLAEGVHHQVGEEKRILDPEHTAIPSQRQLHFFCVRNDWKAGEKAGRPFATCGLSRTRNFHSLEMFLQRGGGSWKVRGMADYLSVRVATGLSLRDSLAFFLFRGRH